MVAGESKPDLHRPGKILFGDLYCVARCGLYDILKVPLSTVLCSEYNVVIRFVCLIVCILLFVFICTTKNLQYEC